MKHCDHSHWLSLNVVGNEASLLESDRLHTLTRQIRDPNTQQPSLLILIGNTSKSLALRELFGIKRARKLGRRTAGEIHLNLAPYSIFHSRPILVADGDLHQHSSISSVGTEKCHDTIRRALPRAATLPLQKEATDTIYSRLLLPFADVFCIFSADVDGFRQIARHLALWLNKAQPSTLPRAAGPRVIIVTEKMLPGPEREKEARKAFLWLLREETACDIFDYISDVHIVALLPDHQLSPEARYRRLKECLLDRSDDVRRNRENTRSLFSATHFATLFRYACDQYAQIPDKPFDFITASRKHNPIPEDLAEHLSTFLKHIKSVEELIHFAVPVIASSIFLDSYPPNAHMFEPVSMFRKLYREVVKKVSPSVITYEGSRDIILRGGFISLLEKQLQEFFDEFARTDISSLEIHRRTLRSFKGRWNSIHSSTTCLSCLRRRPQYGLPCGHIVSENCAVLFGDCSIDDPWIFNINSCFLCQKEISEVAVRVHPPTAGVAVLSIDGGGTRGVLPLKFMQRIQERIGLPILPQRFFKVIIGTSSGGLDSAGMFIEGWTVEESLDRFKKLAEVAFTARKDLGIPFISWIINLWMSFVFDGLYPAAHIEAALKEAFGERRILDYSYATSIGARVGFTVATIREPSRCLFTNYNGVGTRNKDQDYHVIQPKDGHGNVQLWEIARSASAAPGFFPPKEIKGVGTFQDAGPLENDPVASALSEVAATFPLVEEPDFIVSLGTGIPRAKGSATSGPSRLWKDKAFPRLCRLFWEKMRDRQLKQVFRAHPRYHRIDMEFDGAIPRLDNIQSINELLFKAQNDPSISKVIESVARCAIASIFYFQLDPLSEGQNGSYTSGFILSWIQPCDPAFGVLLKQLIETSATFYFNDFPIPGLVGDSSFIGKDGAFRKRVELNNSSRFTISLKQGDAEPCNISGSPYSTEKLITAQELHAHFGTADHGKRKRSIEYEFSSRKRQRVRELM